MEGKNLKNRGDLGWDGLRNGRKGETGEEGWRQRVRHATAENQYDDFMTAAAVCYISDPKSVNDLSARRSQMLQ